MDENITMFVNSCNECPKGFYIKDLNYIYCEVLKKIIYENFDKINCKNII